MQYQQNHRPESEENKINRKRSLSTIGKRLTANENINQNNGTDIENIENSSTDNFFVNLQSCSSSSIKTLIQISEETIHRNVERCLSNQENVNKNLNLVERESPRKSIKGTYTLKMEKNKKYKRFVKNARINFKAIRPSSQVTSKLREYYKKYSRNGPTNCVVQWGITSNTISNLIPRSRICKKHHAEKKNLEGINEKSFNQTNLFPATLTNLASESLSTYKGKLKRDGFSEPSIKVNAEHINFQGDIISVNIAQIKNRCRFNDYRNSLELGNDVNIDLKEYHTVRKPLNTGISNLTSIFSIKGNFSNAMIYSSDENSKTTFTYPNISNTIFVNSSSVLNQHGVESEYTLIPSRGNTVIIDENSNKVNQDATFPKITQTPQLTNELADDDISASEADKVSRFYSNKEEVDLVSVNGYDIFDSNKNKTLKVHSESDFPNTMFSADKGYKASFIAGMEYSQNDWYNTKTQNNFSKNELWEALTQALDITVKRLEDTLCEKIVEEINKSLSTFGNSINTHKEKKMFKKSDEDQAHGDRNNDERFSGNSCKKIQKDVRLQCTLVSTSYIEEQVEKLKFEKTSNIPKIKSHAILSKVKEPKLIVDYLKDEISPKGQTSSKIVVKDRGDSATISIEDAAAESSDRFRRIKMLFRHPIRFLVENAFVIISVPTFLFVLIVLYGAIVLAMKPW